MDVIKYMKLAIKEAKISLKEGNNGFGAVIIKNDEIISCEHDKECTENNPISHAEINAIIGATKKLGKKLTGCTLVATHEPCPMCATAIVWSGISSIAYGYSIEEAIKQGRKRINLTCEEIFERANANILIEKDILKNECSILYNKLVRIEIEKLKNADDKKLEDLNKDSLEKRIEWFNDNKGTFNFINEDILFSAYKLLLKRFNITEDEAPIIEKTDKKILFHSQNFCPTLEACKILDIDTRKICKKFNECSTNSLIKQINPKLKFSRNYEKLRPYSSYCEEIITIE